MKTDHQIKKYVTFVRFIKRKDARVTDRAGLEIR